MAVWIYAFSTRDLVSEVCHSAGDVQSRHGQEGPVGGHPHCKSCFRSIADLCVHRGPCLPRTRCIPTLRDRAQLGRDTISSVFSSLFRTQLAALTLKALRCLDRLPTEIGRTKSPVSDLIFRTPCKRTKLELTHNTLGPISALCLGAEDLLCCSESRSRRQCHGSDTGRSKKQSPSRGPALLRPCSPRSSPNPAVTRREQAQLPAVADRCIWGVTDIPNALTSESRSRRTSAAAPTPSQV